MIKAVNILKGLEGCMEKFESEKNKVRNHVTKLSKIKHSLGSVKYLFCSFIVCM